MLCMKYYVAIIILLLLIAILMNITQYYVMHNYTGEVCTCSML